MSEPTVPRRSRASGRRPVLPPALARRIVGVSRGTTTPTARSRSLGRRGTRTFSVDGRDREFVLEQAIVTDLALARAWKGRPPRQPRVPLLRPQLQPVAAMAGRFTIAEFERLFEPGDLAPDEIHLPGIYVDRVIALTPDQVTDQVTDKRIAKRTVRPERSLAGARSGDKIGG